MAVGPVAQLQRLLEDVQQSQRDVDWQSSLLELEVGGAHMENLLQSLSCGGRSAG